MMCARQQSNVFQEVYRKPQERHNMHIMQGDRGSGPDLGVE